VKNLLLRDHVRAKIDARVDKLLEELGHPSPPLDLGQVRQTLELSRDYFSSDTEDLLKLTLHRVKMAGRQIIRRPTLLVDAVRKFELRALYLPDQKQILIDKAVPLLKHRWLGVGV
jgi:hypothetical protein